MPCVNTDEFFHRLTLVAMAEQTHNMTKTISRLTMIFLTVIVLDSCDNRTNNEAKKSVWDGTTWISFEWKGDSIGNKYFDKIAMFIPVTFKGIPDKFKAQFDLGSNASVIYGNSFNPYLTVYPEYTRKLDTINTEVSVESEKQGELKNVELSLDSFNVTLAMLPYFKNYGNKMTADSLKSATIKHIGTIGADIVQNKILIIDYQNKRMTILDSLNPELKSKFDFVDCKMTRGRFIIPLTVNGKIQWYMFDTGASLFPIITDEDNWKSFCDISKIDTLKIASWGTFYNVYGAKTNKDIYFNKTKLPPTTAYMMTLKSYIEMFKQEQISGTTGNAYFLNNIVALDFKRAKFGVMTVDK